MNETLKKAIINLIKNKIRNENHIEKLENKIDIYAKREKLLITMLLETKTTNLRSTTIM